MSAVEEFAFLLALQLGLPDPHAMMAAMPAAVFNGWRQFWQKEPFGPHADWLRNGLLAATVANSNPFRGKDALPAKIDDFMPPDPDKKRAAPLSEHDRLLIGARAMGATIQGMRGKRG